MEPRKAVLEGVGQVIDGKTGEVKCTFKLQSAPITEETAKDIVENHERNSQQRP